MVPETGVVTLSWIGERTLDGNDGSGHRQEPEERAVAAETRRLRKMQSIVDRVEAQLRRGGLSEEQQASIIAEARDACARFFPEKLDLFDLLYMPRFRRAIAEADERQS